MEERTFAEFPEKATCPLCATNENKECCLVPIDMTENGNLCEAYPVHVDCLKTIARFRYNKKAGVIYAVTSKG